MSQRWSDEARQKFRSPEYRAWTMMKTRCLNTNNEKYPLYGGRGITICKEWQDSFDAFLADMGERPSSAHSLDRIDTDGHYEPENCRWATASEQAINRRTTRWVEVGGERLNLQQWADRLGADPQTISDRLERGWSAERAVTTPPRATKHKGPVYLEHNGERLRLHEWAERTGISAPTLHKRLKRGWSVERTLTTLVKGRT